MSNLSEGKGQRFVNHVKGSVLVSSVCQSVIMLRDKKKFLVKIVKDFRIA